MKRVITKILFLAGIALIFASFAIVVCSQLSLSKAAAANTEIVASLYSIMPEEHNGFFDDRANTAMPAVELNGKDYVGIIEIPLYNTSLPVASSWGKRDVTSLPCRYSGSLYDGSLIIGASEAQFKSADTISVGDEITFTDMTGAVFNYIISDIRVSDKAEIDALLFETADLSVFVKDTLSSKYTIIFCNLES